ncbi:PKD domain-containing protein [Methanofollis ethanolicus]|uniref:PKD domain-containing protein n=1 Tax=Methanofollis ethanolicus TaxID=488124 RepID=UPI000833A4CE|nr:PKD domain-containing protein [Methanofollis ethanolicus]
MTNYAYTWDFGDGSAVSHDENPTHIFETPGTYTVTLTAAGPGGSTEKTTTITATWPAPVAGFTPDKTSGNYPLTVTFADASTGNITSRSWAFGDGETSTETSPAHTYAAAGNYTAKLTVTGPGGSNSKEVAITVGHPAPVAGFTADKTSGIAPLTVTFTNNSTGDLWPSA